MEGRAGWRNAPYGWRSGAVIAPLEKTPPDAMGYSTGHSGIGSAVIVSVVSSIMTRVTSPRTRSKAT